MNKPLLVRGARQLLTLYGPSGPRRGPAMRDLGLIENGAVLIADGKICEVGPARRVENLAAARTATEINAEGRVVMPGFVDSHTHLVCGRPRLTDYEMRIAGATYQEIAAAGGGILSTVRAVRASSTRRLEAEARRSLEDFLRHGTTTVEAKSGYGLDEATELKSLRALAALSDTAPEVIPTYLGAHVSPPEYEGNSDGYIDWICSHMLPKIRQRRLARFVDVYCEPGAFSVDQARRYLGAAAALGIAGRIHAEQFTRSGGAALAVELGAASADHLDYVNDSDMALLAHSATVATLLPGAVFHLGLSRYPPARALIDAGAAVALATDFNPGTSPTCSMSMILSLACTQMRMTPAEAITAATINGAHALRCGGRAGSLECGKSADLIVVNASDYREIPYHFGMNLVAMTMKHGDLVYPRLGVR